MSDGMSGLWPQGMGHLADPVFSAFRHITPYTLAVLYSGNVTGTGTTILDARANLIGALRVTISGNNASATLLGSVDGTAWKAVSATAGAAGTTAIDTLTAYYPYYAARVDWVSGGTRTAYVNYLLSLK